MEFLGGGSCLDLVQKPILSLSIPLTANSSNPAHSMKPTSRSYVENSSSDSNTFTKRARYTETSRLRMCCYLQLARSSSRILESRRSSQISNRNETHLLAHHFGWLPRLYNRLGMISRRTYGLWGSLRWSSFTESLRMRRRIL